MKRYIVILGIFFVFTAPIVSSAQTQFTRNLFIGIQGNDVLELQRFLNRDARTQLTNTGPGSPGSETTYFGPLTHSAVTKFQELYTIEILTPIGLTKGTGFVGSMTKIQLNKILNLGSNEKKSVTALPPKIFSVTPTRGGIGTTITIKGSGFLPTGNSVVAVFEEFNNVSSPDGSTLEVTFVGPFPQDFIDENQKAYNELQLEVPYTILVRNNSGGSNTAMFYFTLYE